MCVKLTDTRFVRGDADRTQVAVKTFKDKYSTVNDLYAEPEVQVRHRVSLCYVSFGLLTLGAGTACASAQEHHQMSGVSAGGSFEACASGVRVDGRRKPGERLETAQASV